MIYTDLIKGYLNVKNIDKMWELYRNIRVHDGIQPDQVLLTLMIRACAEVREIITVLPLFLISSFSGMKSKGHLDSMKR